AFSYSNSLETPDFVGIEPWKVGTYVVRFVRILGDNGSGVGQVKTHTVRKSIHAISPSEGQLPSTGTQVSVIRVRNASSEGCGKRRRRPHHVIRIAAIDIERCSKTVIKGPQIHATIPGTYG